MQQDINVNAFAFEEIGTSLAGLASYFDSGDGDMNLPVREFCHFYTRALQEPLGYREITELTGNAIEGADLRAGRAAWLLLRLKSMRVLEVHSKLFHLQREGKLSSLLLKNLAAVLEVRYSGQTYDVSGLYHENLILDVVGIVDDEVWFVQTVHGKDRINSAVSHPDLLVRDQVFENVVLEESQIDATYAVDRLMRRHFPSTTVRFLVLACHREQPDFELYHVSLRDDRPAKMAMSVEDIVTNSLEHASMIREDHESLWRLPARLQDDSFHDVPPCRGGRTLGILASTARRQLVHSELLKWRESELRTLMEEDYNYRVSRDKIRHDLVDRMCHQAFLRKWGRDYFLTPKGIARYLYCLAKYTTIGSPDPMEVLEEIRQQRDRTVRAFNRMI